VQPVPFDVSEDGAQGASAVGFISHRFPRDESLRYFHVVRCADGILLTSDPYVIFSVFKSFRIFSRCIGIRH
jgi:hypothetical protein